MTMISVQGVSKRFGKKPAVHSVSLEVPRGVVYGLLGHNGAGKSTIIGMMLGQVLPDQGCVLINGFDVASERSRALAKAGAIFETPAFYDYLSGHRNLKIFCEYSAPVDNGRLTEIVRMLDLEHCIHDRVSTYSHGMRQRLAIAQAMLPNPELLILDEPGEGLDPEGIHEVRNLILNLNRDRGLTIVFSSHLLHEVQQVCSHLAVLRKGHLVYTGDWRNLEKEQDRVRIRVDRQAEAQIGLQQAGLAVEFDHDGCGRLAPGVPIAEVTRWLVTHGFGVERVEPVQRTLEEFYLEIVRRPPTESRA